MYCTASDVRSIIHTGLKDSEIETIIELSDAAIDKRIGSQSTGDPVIKKLSMLIAASTIRTRQPGTVAVGEYREEAGDIQSTWAREIEATYRLYSKLKISSSSYKYIDENERSER